MAFKLGIFIHKTYFFWYLCDFTRFYCRGGCFERA